MDPRVEKIFKLPFYQRLVILLVIVALIGTGFYFFFYAPQLEEMSSLESEQSAKMRKLEENRRIANNLPKFKAEYEELKVSLEKALIELPNKKEIPSLLTSISSKAKEQGLEILLFKPMGEVNRGFYAEVPVEIKLQGSYHDVAMFFYQVGQLPRIVNINNLTMEKVSEAKLRVDCRATTFRFVENASENQGG